MIELGASMVAIVTPMHEDGVLDLASLEALVEWHIESGTQSIVVLGTTGEAPTITAKERPMVIECVLKQAAGRIPVIAGTGANATAASIDLTRAAKGLGVDACLIVTPYYNKPPQEGLYQHFMAIAEAVDMPLIVYNVPGRTGCDLLPETLGRLADHHNIVAIKDATGDLSRLAANQAACEDKAMLYYSGDDLTAADFMLQGGHGTISVTANVLPDQIAKLCQHALAKDEVQTQALQAKLMSLHRQLFVESNPIPVKWALHQMGKLSPGIRLPLVALSDCHREALADMMAACV